MAEPSSSRQRTGGPSGATGGPHADGDSGSGDGIGGGTTIEALPDACLCLIFEQLGVAAVAGPTVTPVCRRWRRLFISHPPLWRYFDLRGCDPELSPAQHAEWAVTKHRLLQRVGLLVREFSAHEIDPQQLGGATGLRLPDFLHCLSPAALENMAFTLATQPLADGMLAALLRFPRLRVLRMMGAHWPPNGTYVLRQLPALQEVESEVHALPVDALQALPGSLTSLELHTHYEPLPDCRQLERLSRLRCLTLSEGRPSPIGLLLPAAAAFPRRTKAQFSSPRLQLPGALLINSQLPVAAPIPPWITICPTSDGGERFAIRLQGLTLGEGSLAAVFAALQTSCQPILSELQLVECQLSSECWPPASKLAHITRLVLAVCEELGHPAGSLADALAPGLQRMTILEAVNVTGCHLPQPPAALSSLSGLHHLSLIRCDVEHMPSITNLTGLQELRLEGTKLAELPELPSAPRLTYLSVRGSSQLNLAVADVQARCQRLPGLEEFQVGDTLSGLGAAQTAGLPSSFVEALVWLARAKPALRIT